jgi:hypothetical protein
MKEQKNPVKKFSYESDGKMGDRKKSDNNKKEQTEFFNTTQNSE